MKRGTVALTFRNGGFTAEESWQEALQIAGKRKLPMIFVCWNGSLAEASRGKRESGRKGALWPEPAFGFPSIAVDGDDVVAVYRVATEAIAHARRGNGPTLISCESWRENHSSAKENGQRGPSPAMRRSNYGQSILNMENYLTGKGLFKLKYRREIVAAFGKEWDTVVAGFGNHQPAAVRRGLPLR